MRQLLSVADGCARGPTRAEFLRVSAGGILRSTGGAGADQPWRNPSFSCDDGTSDLVDRRDDAFYRPRDLASFRCGTRPRSAAPTARGPKLLLDSGGRLLDSWLMCGLAEGVLGDLLIEMAARPGVFLATKVLTTGRERGLEQMQRSAQLLRTQVIDLMQCTIWWTDD